MGSKFDVWITAQAQRNTTLVTLAVMAIGVTLAYVLIDFYPVRWQPWFKRVALVLGIALDLITFAMSVWR